MITGVPLLLKSRASMPVGLGFRWGSGRVDAIGPEIRIHVDNPVVGNILSCTKAIELLATGKAAGTLHSEPTRGCAPWGEPLGPPTARPLFRLRGVIECRDWTGSPGSGPRYPGG